MRIGLSLLVLSLLLVLGACATVPRDSLYQQLGGAEGVASLVDAIIEKSRTDPRIGELFAETDFDYFRERLIEQICELADGPCEYTGLPMSDAHSGMDISEREFNWFVEDVEQAMQQIGLPLAVQNRLLARLVPMHEDVIRQ
ncbi:MAG: group 1 truncated hemoglobin [Lysobacterales bacterium]